MYYFPFVDWIEGLVKWVRQYTLLFWVSTLSASITLALAVKIWQETGSVPRIMLLVGVGLFIVTMISMRLFPKKFQRHKEKKDDTEKK